MIILHRKSPLPRPVSSSTPQFPAGDPAWLARFRALALSLPQAVEQPHFHLPSFRIRNKIFATLWEADGKAMVKLTPEQQDDFTEAHPQSIEPVHGTWGAQGATLVKLTGKSAAKASLLRELLRLAWRNAAPKSLIAQQEMPSPREGL